MGLLKLMFLKCEVLGPTGVANLLFNLIALPELCLLLIKWGCGMNDKIHAYRCIVL